MSSDLSPRPPSPGESDNATPPPGQPVQTLPGTTGLAPNVAAGLAMVFLLIGGIVFLVLEKKDRYVRFWAMQSVLFGLAWFVLRIFSAAVFFLFRGPFGFISTLWALLAGVVGVGLLVIWIIALIQAFSGKEWEIPVLGKLARQQVGKILP